MSIIEYVILITGIIYFCMLVYLWFGLRRLQPYQQLPPDNLPEVAVVVAARNEEEHIADTVRSLVNQNYPDERYEIVVVNDRSEDKTLNILHGLQKEISNLRVLTIKQVPEGVSPKKHALITAVNTLSCDFIAATDADCLHHPDWLQTYASAAEPSLGIATSVTVFSKDTYTSKLEHFCQTMQNIEHVSEHLVTAGAIVHGWGLSANGNNMLFNKKLYGEDSDAAVKKLVTSGDDFFLIQTAENRGYRLKFLINPESVVRTPPQPTLGETLNQRARWASKIGHGSVKVILPGTLVFLFYSGLLLYPLTAIWGAFQPNFFLGALGLKIAPETVYMLTGYKKLHWKFPVAHFVGMEIVHIPFILFSVLKGMFGGFIWKGTHYRR